MKRSCSEANIGKNEGDEKRIKIENDKSPPTGREIIDKFNNGDVAASITYKKICLALQSFENWKSDVPKIQLLEQFLDNSDLFDMRTETLVNNLLRLKWNTIPESIFSSYISFITNIGIRQLCFTELVLKSVFDNFLPHENEEKQFEYFKAGHKVIVDILNCFPMSTKLVLTCARKCLPHYTQPLAKTGVYLKNLIVLQCYSPLNIRKTIWEIILERLVKEDAYFNLNVSEKDVLTKIDDNEGTDIMKCSEPSTVDEKPKKGAQFTNFLDDLCSTIMEYNNYSFDAPNEEMTSEQVEWVTCFGYNHKNTAAECAEHFDIFMHCLESVMLNASFVKNVSIIFLHLCSLKREYAESVLKILWNCVCRMPRAPSDTKLSHGAAGYLAAFISRAKYVPKKDAYYWLQQMIEWLRGYIDQLGNGSSQITPGLGRHGTFYAISQAFFLVFVFRYRELVKNSEVMEEMKHWGIGRIVHSQLEPLKFVSRPVAVGFSAISRSLQLVYCSHVLSNDNLSRPFDNMFPFDSFQVKCSSKISDLLRMISPLSEDSNMANAAMCWNAAAAQKEADMESAGSVDFLDDYEIDFGRERALSFGQRSLISYADAPGLKTLDLKTN